MKNIIEICKDFGFEVPAEKHADFLKAVNGEYKTVADYEKKVNRLTEDLAAEKKRADTAVETLKGFEGKDFDAITRERDEWKRKHDENQQKYQQEQEEREYNEDVEQAGKDANCIDIKAASVYLPHEQLRKSKNRKADMKAAFDNLRTEKGYFFSDNGGTPYFTGPKGNNGGGGTKKKWSEMTLDERITLKKTNPKLYESMRKGE